MEVELKINLTIPDDAKLVEGQELESLRQLIFDEFINYATCSHLNDSIDWLSNSHSREGEEQLRYNIIAKHHMTWADICQGMNWDITSVSGI